ncbi:MAG: rRNA maturation RNase YbeY, partial [Gammaproteobacteria bacterium]
MNVDVQYAVHTPALPSAEQFRSWANAAALESDDCEVVVRVVDEDESAELNMTYRGKSGPTNVLSFPFEPPPGVDLVRTILGDVVICAPVVSREAELQGKPENDHWAHMMVHAMLHLQGFDHARERDAVRMEA